MIEEIRKGNLKGKGKRDLKGKEKEKGGLKGKRDLKGKEKWKGNLMIV